MKWLANVCQQLAELIGRDRSVIGRHIRNVFAEGELERESNVQNLHIAGSDKPVALYNPDAVILLGYRVKPREGTRFRQWANQILKQHLTRGFTLNRERFEANARELEAHRSWYARPPAHPNWASMADTAWWKSSAATPRPSSGCNATTKAC